MLDLPTCIFLIKIRYFVNEHTGLHQMALSINDNSSRLSDAINLHQHLHANKEFLEVWWYQAIIWINVHLPLARFCSIILTAISQQIPIILYNELLLLKYTSPTINDGDNTTFHNHYEDNIQFNFNSKTFYCNSKHIHNSYIKVRKWQWGILEHSLLVPQVLKL